MITVLDQPTGVKEAEEKQQKFQAGLSKPTILLAKSVS